MNFKKIIKKKLHESIDESGFARARRIMLGDVPNINSIGICTAENPMAQQLAPNENNKRQRELINDLRSKNLGFIKVAGKYGNKENSLLIPNISKEDLIYLGQKYQQESVIYGEKKFKDDFAYFNFQFIVGDSVDQERNVSLSNKDIQSRDDFFSAIKNRKFIIPFFDDEYENLKPSKNFGSTNVNQNSIGKLEKV